MQGTRVRVLVQEDPTCRGATKPVSHNYWARVPQLLKPVRLEPVLRNKEEPPQWEARAPQGRVAPACRNQRKPTRTATKTQRSPPKKKEKNKNTCVWGTVIVANVLAEVNKLFLG